MINYISLRKIPTFIFACLSGSARELKSCNGGQLHCPSHWEQSPAIFQPFRQDDPSWGSQSQPPQRGQSNCQSKVWPVTQFFSFAFCKSSLLCQGKSKTYILSGRKWYSFVPPATPSSPPFTAPEPRNVGRFRNYREIRTPSRKTDANFDFVFVKTDFFTMTHGAMFKVGAKNLFVFTLLVKNISVVYSAARCNS